MARTKTPDLADFAALRLEGGIIPPAILARVARTDAGAQDEADYALPPGLTLREELPRFFRIGQALHEKFARIENPSAKATVRFATDLLREVFGFADLAPEAGTLLTAGCGRVPVVVVPPSDPLDRPSDLLSAERRRSASGLLQDQLNDTGDALWGLACNGTLLRLMRDNNSLTRPAWLEADIAEIFGNEDFASFTVLWLLVHRTRFGRDGTAAHDCALERWRDAGAREGEAARDRLRDGVEAALKVLGTGFLEANPDLRARLADGTLPLDTFFTELLRLVYRLIFLMVAEDRELLHAPEAGRDARELYRDGYSLAQLRARARRRSAWDRHHDRWEGLKIVFRALSTGQAKLGLPALGGLFAPGVVPDLDAARLPNRALMEAVYRLAWLTHDGALVPVNWRAMETEELGSVYESLLELTPRLAQDARRLAFAEDAAETRGNQRKTTGSYYTPDSLVQALLDSALDPVLDRVEGEAEEPPEALLKVTVIDPACGSGHFLLAAARRIAARVARHRAGGTPGAEDYRHALRDVARSCLHGVDRNPMAVELAKVALWIETVEPGKPLGFLDATIRCGDALFGVYDLGVLEDGIPDAAYKPLAGDDRETAKHFLKRNRAEREGQGSLDFGRGGGVMPLKPLGARVADVRALPEDTVGQVEEKARRFREMQSGGDWHDLRLACDLYVAAFLCPKTGGPPPTHGAAMIPTTGHIRQALSRSTVYGPLVGRARDLATDARALHWPLEFPEVMAHGGFDVVLGNPPWEVIQLKEEEYFARLLPDISKLVGDLRKSAIAALEKERPSLFHMYQCDKRRFEAANRFVKTSAHFELTTVGKINTFALFSELYLRLSADRGRAGIIVPTGIVTDSNCSKFFSALLKCDRLISMLSFDNRRGLFPAVHRDTSFGLLTIGSANGEPPLFVNEALQIIDLQDERRGYQFDRSQLLLTNPNTGTAPVFRSREDARLTTKIYRKIPILVNESKTEVDDTWRASFLSMLNIASDNRIFRTKEQLQRDQFDRNGLSWISKNFSGSQPSVCSIGYSNLLKRDDAGVSQCYLPLYEGKMIDQFNHRAGSFGGMKVRPPRGASLPSTREEQYADPDFEPEPWYWVPQTTVSRALSEWRWERQWTFGYRFGANPANERTVCCAAIPLAATPHVFIQVLIPDSNAQIAGAVLPANLNAIVLDYVCRQKMARPGLDIFILKQLPVLPPSTYTPDRLSFVVPRVLELTYTSHAMAPFARDLGHAGPPFAWDEDRRAHLRAELDAFYARAYGLTRDELRYVLDPADVKGPDYPSETFRVLKTNEIRKHGEYRTARLVLAAWDRMEHNGEFARLGLATPTPA